MHAHTASAPSSSKKGRRLNPSVLSDAQLAFNEFVDANIFGQADGRRLIKQAYTNYLNPLRDRTKPIAFIVLAGESRSGKTETARLIPRFVHKNPEALLKINCSEYLDKYHLSNLIGSPRGYISNQTVGDEKYQNVPATSKHGYAEFMNHNLEWSKKGSDAPLTVVLLDEWEKACYEMNLLLLQIMDDGFLTLGSGEIVDFRNTIFVATTNIGMREVEEEQKGGIGFNARSKVLSHGEVSSTVMEEIRKRTPPEFRNRVKELGGVAVYERLTPAQMRLVLDRDLMALQAKIHEAGLSFSVGLSVAAKDELMRLALSNSGAIPMVLKDGRKVTNLIGLTEEEKDIALNSAAVEGGNLSNLKGLISTLVTAPLGTEAIKGAIRAGEYVFVDVVLAEGSTVPSFDFEAQDPLGGTLFGAGLADATTSVGAGDGGKTAISGADEEEDGIDPSLYEVGQLLGVRPGRVMLVALGHRAAAPGAGTGFLLADQLASLGLMPKLPGVFTDIHNMTMLTNAAAIKSKVERFPELARSYVIELKDGASGLNLSSRASELVHELTEYLGVVVEESRMTHSKPYTFTMKVKGLPEAIQFCLLRFGRVGVTVREITSTGPDAA